MSAHTPGPWVADRKLGGVVKGGPVQHFSNGSGQTQVALATGQEWMSEGEQNANAHLIAAAPDLLAACEEAETIVEDLERFDPGAQPVYQAFLANVRAAIAKARGE